MRIGSPAGEPDVIPPGPRTRHEPFESNTVGRQTVMLTTVARHQLRTMRCNRNDDRHRDAYTVERTDDHLEATK